MSVLIHLFKIKFEGNLIFCFFSEVFFFFPNVVKFLTNRIMIIIKIEIELSQVYEK